MLQIWYVAILMFYKLAGELKACSHVHLREMVVGNLKVLYHLHFFEIVNFH